MTFEDLGRVLVVIPTYDERDNLEIILGRVRTAVPEAHVLVVDDNSPDGTGDLADAAAASDDHVHVLHRTAKDGLGRAYIAGFRWALGESYDVVVEMDADGSHSPEQLPRLLDRLRTADLVLGARYVPGGSVVNWPLSRQVISRGGNLYVRMLLRVPLKDATGGYRAFRAEVLRSFDLDDVSSQGYCFQVDLMWRAWKLGYRIAEVPITFVERERGVSKMSGGIFKEALVNVARWGLTTRGGAVRKKALAERAARSSAEESG